MMDLERVRLVYRAVKEELDEERHFPVRMDEMTERELIIANMACDFRGTLTWIERTLAEALGEP
jgi:hypothetical protein